MKNAPLDAGQAIARITYLSSRMHVANSHRHTDLILEDINAIARNCQPSSNLRDRIAIQIAGGLAAFSGTAGVSYGPGDIAGRAYEVADAMLAAREKGGGA